MDNHATEIADLRARADDLERKLTAISSVVNGGRDALARKWNLNPGQARILAALADGCVYSIFDLAAIYARSGEGNVKTARIEIHRLRRKIAPIEIRSIYGRGHRLDEPHLSTVLSVMGGQA
jgi:hypothetical protein